MSVPRVPGFGVVGTDTGAGKTTLSRGFLALARQKGYRPAAFKPVESGVGPHGPSDAQLLQEAASSSLPASLYALPLPIAPARAARHAGVSLDFRRMEERARELAIDSDGIVLESAGGLLSPWQGGRGVAELLGLLDLPSVVVAADVLGAQNHARLTLEALETRRLSVLGVVLVARSADDAACENPETFQELFGSTYLGRLPHIPRLTADAIAESVAQHLDCRPLFAALRQPK